MDTRDCGHSHNISAPSVHQSLDELDFERGIWGAAFDGNAERLENLLSKGNDPSLIDSCGYTALHYSARNGKDTTCRILLEKGANPNAQTPGGATPLQRAAFVGDISIASILLKYNANPALCDSDGKNALHKAAEGQHLSVSKILVTYNPELKKEKDKRGLLPSDYVDSKNVELKNLLSIHN